MKKTFKSIVTVLLTFAILLSTFAFGSAMVTNALELNVELGYYNSTKGSEMFSTTKTVATQIFTREELPNGTEIRISQGYKYRPEGWVSLDQVNETRPSSVWGESTVIVDDEWWGDFNYRVFNISEKNESVDMSNKIGTISSIFTITLPEEIEEKTIRVLAIGNSFSNDAYHYAEQIAAEFGYKTEFYSLYASGCSLKTHLSNYNNNTEAYTVYRNGVQVRGSVTMNQILKECDYDYITLQQASASSNDWSTYEPYLESLYNIVKEQQPKAQFLIHQTWGYYQRSTHFPQIEECYNKAAALLGGLPLVKSGKAIQITKDYNFLADGRADEGVENAIYADEYSHLTNKGDFIASCVLVETIFGVDTTTKDFTLLFADAKNLTKAAHSAVTGEPIAEDEEEVEVYYEPQRTMLQYKRTSNGYNKCLYKLPTALEANTEYTITIATKFGSGSSLNSNTLYFNLYGIDEDTSIGSSTNTALTASGALLRSSGTGTKFTSVNVKSYNCYKVYSFTLTEEEAANKKFYLGYAFDRSAGVEFYISDFSLYKSSDEDKKSLLNIDDYSTNTEGWCDMYGQPNAMAKYVEYNPSYFKYMAHFKYTGNSTKNIGCVVNSGAIKKNVKYTISYDYYFVSDGFDNGVFPFLFGTKAERNALSSSVAYYDRVYSYNYNPSSSKTQFGDKVGGEYNSKSGYASYSFTITDNNTLRDKYYVGFQLQGAADFYISNLKLTAEGSDENLLPVDEYQYSFNGSNSGEKWRENDGWIKNVNNDGGDATGFGESNYVAYGTADGNIDGEVDIRDLVTADETVVAKSFNPFLDTNVDRTVDKYDIANVRYRILGLGLNIPKAITKPQEPEKPKPKPSGSNLILNSDGSYGGSLNEELYGKGAPLNGEYDVENSDYYTVNNDYYNMESTEERVIFPNFSSYQQTMQDTDGLACLMTVLNYAGKDVNQEYNELALLNKYEEVNGTTVYGNGTTDQGLVALINSLDVGFTAKSQDFGSYDKTKDSSMKQFFINTIKEGKFILVRYQSPVGFKWKVVIGYDTLGYCKNARTGADTEYTGDDVIIFAEPNDSFDHSQDGYATERFYGFYKWWLKMEQGGAVSNKYSCVVIDPNLDIEFDYKPVDQTVKQTLYDIHLPLNDETLGDGITYGGTRDYDLYGSISTGNGLTNHTNANYYKINDFYNMGSQGSCALLKNYTVLQQTMGSSCGICSVNSVLSYYGHQDSQYALELNYLKQYESATGITVKGYGTTVDGHYTALKGWGYSSVYNVIQNSSSLMSYSSYMQFMRSNINNGKPIVVTNYIGSDHAMTVIGLDDMGTDYIYDDVIIVADSNDWWDGYMDGYVVHSAYKFYTQHSNASRNKFQSYIVINKK